MKIELKLREVLSVIKLREKTLLSVFVSLFFITMILGSLTCGSLWDDNKGMTEYYSNQIKDSDRPVSYDAIKSAIGENKFNALYNSMGREEFDTLSYGIGESNMIILTNSVGDVDRLVQMFKAPNAMTATDSVNLLNAIDTVIRANPTVPSNDTIGKNAVLINNLTTVQIIKDLVAGMVDVPVGSPTESKFVRLGTVTAWFDEKSYPTRMSDYMNDVYANGDMNRLILMMNTTGVGQMKKMADVVNNLTSTKNLTDLIHYVNNNNGGSLTAYSATLPDGMRTLIENTNGVSDAAKLGEMISNLTAYSTTAISGVRALVVTMNTIVNNSRLISLTEQLALTTDVSNNENFDSASGLNGKFNWAVKGTNNTAAYNWAVANNIGGHDKSACAGSSTGATLSNDDVSSIELPVRIWTAGNVTYNYYMVSGGSDDVLKFYIDGVERASYTGTPAGSWITTPIVAITTGFHVIRWDYIKGGATGNDCACIDTVVMPGNRGAASSPSRKTSYMFNNLPIANQTVIANVLDLITSAQGIANMAYLTNKTMYPDPVADGSTAGMVVQMGNLNTTNGKTVLANILMNLTPGTQVQQLLTVMDMTLDPARNAYIMNNLETSTTGPHPQSVAGMKMYEMFQKLNPSGTTVMIYQMNQVPVADVSEMMKVQTTYYMPDLFNALRIDGPAPNAQERLIGLIKGIATASSTSPYPFNYTAGNGPTIAYHIVRQMNQMSAYTLHGATAVQNMQTNAKMINGLTSGNAANKLGSLFRVLYHSASTDPTVYTYNDPFSTDATDDFGRLIVLTCDTVNEEGDANANTNALNNAINFSTTPANDRMTNLASLIKTISRVRFNTAQIRAFNAQGVANLAAMLNLDLDAGTTNGFPNSNVKINLAAMSNAMGAKTYHCTTTCTGRDATDYTDQDVDSLQTDMDALGRNAALMNNLFPDSPVTGQPKPVTNLVTLMARSTSADYITILTSNTAKIDSTGADITGCTDTIGKSDCGFDRVRFVTGTLNYLKNPIILANMNAGITSPVTIPPVDLRILSRHMNEVGHSTRLGMTRTKAVGDMYIEYDTMNKLACLPQEAARAGGDEDYCVEGDTNYRPMQYQMQIVYMVNGIRYCGVNTGAAENYIIDASHATSGTVLDPAVDYIQEGAAGCPDASSGGPFAGLKKLSQLMLMSESGRGQSIMTGSANNIHPKVVRAMNSLRQAATNGWLMSWVPAEVLEKLFATVANETCVHKSMVYLMNNTPVQGANQYPDVPKYIAYSQACQLHYGTKIGDPSDEGQPRNGSPVYEYTGIGPGHIGTLLSVISGADLLSKMVVETGWKLQIPQSVCGMNSPTAANPQYLRDYSYHVGTDMGYSHRRAFYRRVANAQNYVDIYKNTATGGTGESYRHNYGVRACEVNNSCTTSYCNDNTYMPEQGGAVTSGITVRSGALDNTVWNGASASGTDVSPGVGLADAVLDSDPSDGGSDGSNAGFDTMYYKKVYGTLSGYPDMVIPTPVPAPKWWGYAGNCIPTGGSPADLRPECQAPINNADY